MKVLFLSMMLLLFWSCGLEPHEQLRNDCAYRFARSKDAIAMLEIHFDGYPILKYFSNKIQTEIIVPSGVCGINIEDEKIRLHYNINDMPALRWFENDDVFIGDIKVEQDFETELFGYAAGKSRDFISVKFLFPDTVEFYFSEKETLILPLGDLYFMTNTISFGRYKDHDNGKVVRVVKDLKAPNTEVVENLKSQILRAY